jgi:putative transposase
MGACRWIYNNYLAKAERFYKLTGIHLSGQDYSKLLTHYKKNNPDYMWLREISSNAVHESFMDADEAYRRFFKGIGGFPKWKSKKKNPINGYFFVGDEKKKKHDKIKIIKNIRFKHNKVNLPILGWTRITENDYVPKDNFIIGGTIKKEGDKYYAVFRTRRDNSNIKYEKEELGMGYGIDLGIKTFAMIANEYYDIFPISSFLNDEKLVNYTNKIEELQRRIAWKYEVNKKKGETNKFSNNCRRLQNKINSYYRKIHNYKKNLIDKLVSILVKLKPMYITIENLDIKGLLQKDEPSYMDLHRRIQDSMFRYFRQKLEEKSILYGFELRVANKFFASSKICSVCGNKKKDLKLSDRIYHCDVCGITTDRDVNAAINLVHLKKYKVI